MGENIINCKFIFPHTLKEEMYDFLFQSRPKENGCYILADYYFSQKSVGKKRINIVAKQIFYPGSQDIAVQTKRRFSPTSQYISKAILKADKMSKALFFVHTHPNSRFPKGFSLIDEITNSELYENYREILGDQLTGSLLLHPSGLSGECYFKGQVFEIDPFFAIGRKFEVLGHLPQPSDNKSFDRQIRAWGKKQSILQSLKVAVIGVGGTGSSISTQLAKMGIKNFVLIDHDKLEKSNIPRVYGSTYKDVKKYKVTVVRKHLMKMDKNIHVIPLRIDITKAKSKQIEQLVDYDFIFGCTDNHLSRSILNDISHKYSIPYVDVGCQISVTNGKIEQSVISVRLTGLELPCLWCIQALVARRIAQEGLTEKEKDEASKSEYYQPIEVQPSIISLTTISASLAIDKFLRYIGTHENDEFHSEEKLELSSFFRHASSGKIKKNCICHRQRKFQFSKS